MARMIGSKVYNFSRGGMTAKEYCETFADSKAYWSPQMAAQCYIIALGVNDLLGQKQEVGEPEDINLDDYTKNKKTFAGYYGEIIQRVRNISPDAKLFFVTMPKADSDDEFASSRKKAHRKLLYNLTEIFGNSSADNVICMRELLTITNRVILNFINISIRKCRLPT